MAKASVPQTRAGRRREERAAKKARPPQAVTLTARRSVFAVVTLCTLAVIYAGLSMMAEAGLVLELIGGVAIMVVALIFTVRAFWLTVDVTIGPDHLKVERRGMLVWEGPYYAARKTFLPIGIGFAVARVPVMEVLTMALRHPFTVNIGRNRLAFSGVFLKGLDALWDAVPEDKKS